MIITVVYVITCSSCRWLVNVALLWSMKYYRCLYVNYMFQLMVDCQWLGSLQYNSYLCYFMFQLMVVGPCGMTGEPAAQRVGMEWRLDSGCVITRFLLIKVNLAQGPVQNKAHAMKGYVQVGLLMLPSSFIYFLKFLITFISSNHIIHGLHILCIHVQTI